MIGTTSGAVGPLLAVLPVIASDLWVYEDARRRALAGAPVVLGTGAVRIATPMTWFVACLALWIVFFPLYLLARTKGPR